jgi:hypothetical protein
MSNKKSLREQLQESAGRVNAISQINVPGFDEALFVRRLSIEERAACYDAGDLGTRAGRLASSISLVTASVCHADRTPFATREEWAAWANDHFDDFAKLASAASAAQGEATASEASEVGNG